MVWICIMGDLWIRIRMENPEPGGKNIKNIELKNLKISVMYINWRLIFSKLMMYKVTRNQQKIYHFPVLWILNDWFQFREILFRLRLFWDPDPTPIIFTQERLADVNVREKIQIFQKLLKILKMVIEAWFFYCFVKKILQNFMQKTDLCYL